MWCRKIRPMLKSKDKWYLGGGKYAVFAPEKPLWLENLGFWDSIHFADQQIDRLYTIIVLDENLEETSFRKQNQEWTPDAFVQKFKSKNIGMTETKLLLPDDSFVSNIEISNRSLEERILHLIVWTAQTKNYETWFNVGDVKVGDNGVQLELKKSDKFGEVSLDIDYDSTLEMEDCLVEFSEGTCLYPSFELSPFKEWAESGFGNRLIPMKDEKGIFHIGMHYILKLQPKSTCEIGFSARVTPKGNSHRPKSSLVNPRQQSRKNWNDFFSSVPYFRCSNPYFEKYYWYRWYGLRLGMVESGMGNLKHESVFEGIGYFRHHITYSAQCHMMETRWMKDQRFARGSLLNFIANQQPDGFIPGVLGINRSTGFYHANWGWNVQQLLNIKGDIDFAGQVYEPLVKYYNYFKRERDKENLYLFDVIDQCETGQEYNPRYLFADKNADDWRQIQLKGIDATVYMYELCKCLERLSIMLGKGDEKKWKSEAQFIKEAVLKHMWDAQTGMFYDVHPKTLEKSMVKAPVCFYPFMTDIAGKEHMAAVEQHLLNPEEFWTEWPVPTLSIDDPYFDANARWKGKRTNCPWNGRVWPMTNSHMVEALANVSYSLDESKKRYTAELISKFIMMMYHDQDLARPNCFEHYNPFTSSPSEYRCIDDYMHSWVNDLIIKYVAGLQPEPDRLVIDPLDFGLNYFELNNVSCKGHDVQIKYNKSRGMEVFIDSKLKFKSKNIERIEIMDSEL